MLNENDPVVQFKLEILKRALPAKSAVVFGDMYIVDGAYTKKCIDYGCESAILFDSFETVNWLDLRRNYPTIDFFKGDFSNPLFMRGVNVQCEIGVVFDILLHQAPLLHTIHLMLEKITNRICIVQPMLKEQALPNSLIYLPGNNAEKELYPMADRSPDYQAFDILAVNHSHWLWGITISFLTSALKGEGFEIIHQQALADFPNPNWFWWGMVAERTDFNHKHWSSHYTIPGLYNATWD
jgi:hypothetical protein